MLHTFLTTNPSWRLRYPIINAPMAYVGRGRLAHAVSRAGGMGMIGIGSKDPVDLVAREAAIARGDTQERFGIGLLGWCLERHPELLEAAIQARPFLISISFGNVAPYVEKIHQQGIYLATQVHSRADAIHAESLGVDLVIAQGAEAGGHTGQVGTLPLLQVVLESVKTPVLAAGGIGSSRGVAAVLAAGAEGAWIGTRFTASPECENSEEARKRIVQANETDTVLTRAFDVGQAIPWPTEFLGRGLRNRFTDQWHAYTEELSRDEAARRRLADAIKRSDYDVAFIYAGEGVGMVNKLQPAGEIVQELGDGAEQMLRDRATSLLEPEKV